jgi:hypothetical protein
MGAGMTSLCWPDLQYFPTYDTLDLKENENHYYYVDSLQDKN